MTNQSNTLEEQMDMFVCDDFTCPIYSHDTKSDYCVECGSPMVRVDSILSLNSLIQQEVREARIDQTICVIAAINANPLTSDDQTIKALESVLRELKNGEDDE